MLAVDQHSSENRPVLATDKIVIWRARSKAGYYIAAFNISPDSQKISYKWSDLGMQGDRYQLRDLWERKDLGSPDALHLELPSHGSVLYSVLEKN